MTRTLTLNLTTENTREGPVTFVRDDEENFLLSYPSDENGVPDMYRLNDEVPDFNDIFEVIFG